MAKSVEERLEETLTAISEITEKGQRYTIKDRELWRGDLRVLVKQAETLQRQVSRAKAGGIRIQRIIPL